MLAYNTSAGWLGYGEEEMKSLLEQTLAKGYKHFKLKLGENLDNDKRRLGIARDVIGYDKGNVLMVDANQVGFAMFLSISQNPLLVLQRQSPSRDENNT